MKSTKTASEIVPGDKIYLTDTPAMPRRVAASYALGDRWALELDGVQQIIQVERADTLQVWTQ